MPQHAVERSDEAAVPREAQPTGGPALVTGGSGFAGAHLVRLLSESGSAPAAPRSGQLDLRDAAAVAAHMRATAPAVVYHLAAFSSPRLSWDHPRTALLTNIEITLNVLEAVRDEAAAAVLVLVGSGQVYGEPEQLPVTEDAPLDPRNPYAVSKASCDLLGCQFAAAHSMHVVRLRPFNHAGPGQSDEYVVSTLARQVAEAEAAGAPEALLRTGNVDAARDFTDVRDVARAYRLAASLPSGAYNVCSGRSVTIAEVIDLLRAHARVPIRAETDPARMRAQDPPEMRGSAERLRAAAGWEPEIPLSRTVADTLEWWRARLAPAPR